MNLRGVLIVDDNPQLRGLLSALLQSDGRFVVVGEAADGHEALRLVEQLDPELVILDLCMPGMDGIEVLERLGELAEPPVTVVLTGYADEELHEQIRSAGAAMCFEKGRDFTNLTERLAASPARPVRHESA